jgi:hypothetical protein
MCSKIVLSLVEYFFSLAQSHSFSETCVSGSLPGGSYFMFIAFLEGWTHQTWTQFDPSCLRPMPSKLMQKFIVFDGLILVLREYFEQCTVQNYFFVGPLDSFP